MSIGRVNVDDADDWDVVDKVYSWAGQEDHLEQQHHYQQHPAGINLEQSTGTVMITKPKVGIHELRFHVFDQLHQQEARSSMSVEVRSVPLQVILSAGSLRILGTSAKTFITAWDRRSRRRVASFKERLETNLKKLVDAEELEIFAINEHSGQEDEQISLDVHYWARSKNRIFSSVYLNSIVQAKLLELNELMGSVSITLVLLDFIIFFKLV